MLALRSPTPSSAGKQLPISRHSPEVTMAEPYLYEAPHQTLFILERRSLRVITYEGHEAVIPVEDLLALVLHLSVRQVAALSVLKDYQFRRLAAGLRRRIHSPNV